jgi:hypothetical protein
VINLLTLTIRLNPEGYSSANFSNGYGMSAFALISPSPIFLPPVLSTLRSRRVDIQSLYGDNELIGACFDHDVGQPLSAFV